MENQIYSSLRALRQKLAKELTVIPLMMKPTKELTVIPILMKPAREKKLWGVAKHIICVWKGQVAVSSPLRIALAGFHLA
jgi:hypothetical protein